MSSNPNFCSNCGEKLDANVDFEECPKCHTALHEHHMHKLSSSPFVKQLPYKSPGTTALIAFLGGLFALPGIGHIYVGKLTRGIIILIGGLVLYIVMIIPVIMAFSIQGLLSKQSMFSPETTVDISGTWFLVVFLMIIFGIGYIVLFIWQIFDARKYAKKFNELVATTGKEPW